ncbi:hypothetical protein CapIbe_007817 [Capra ibex]
MSEHVLLGEQKGTHPFGKTDRWPLGLYQLHQNLNPEMRRGESQVHPFLVALRILNHPDVQRDLKLALVEPPAEPWPDAPTDAPTVCA